MVKRNVRLNALGLVVIALFVGTIFASAIVVEPAQAASVISFKWSVNIGPWMTEVGPLSADLFGNGQQEIVLVGGPSNWGTAGAVTCLNGTSHKTIWQVTSNQIPNIGIDGHTTFDLVDINKDGLPEIVVYGLNGPLVLNGTNGNLIWRNTLAAGGNVYGAAVDVDGDGYPEIFVSRGIGPLVGYDALTELDHNGNILRQAFSWHPCWGGLTVADPAGDGHFKIFQGDRSNTYSASTDPYTGGGLGIHCLDANTLTQLWSDPTVLCSSQAPILADVDHDGVLDVIVADQTTSGVVVLNSTDGSVLTTGGPYRKGGTNMPAHSTPTVADLHGDGNLELVDCDGSSTPKGYQGPYPIIWDLYNWKLDGFLPVNCSEPPKAGNVTGGSTLDLIAVAGGIGEQGGGNSIYIYSWNGTAYVQRGDPVTGLNYVRPFTLVQDVDGDGINELVLSSDSGMVYCYGTPAKVSNPMVRSGLTFYSEDKRGAAVYVAPAIPSQPVLKQESPIDRSVNQSLSPTLSVLVTSFQGYSLTVRFNGTDSLGNWNNIDGAQSGQSRVYSVTALGMSKTGTQYYWGVSAEDSHGNRASGIYTFTTYSNPPIQNAPILNSTNSGDLTCYNQSTSDPAGNGVTNIYNWYVNNASLANLYLPFDTRTSNNPMSSDMVFADGFENNFNLWSTTGNWNRDTSQAHSGSYSAHATFGDNYLTSNNIDASGAGGITVSFWYRKQNIADADNVYLQFGVGSVYRNIFQLRNPSSENAWQFYSFQTYDSEYYVSNFRIRFVAGSISSTSKNIWVDDVSIIVPTRTMDYSGHGNNGTVHGAAWTSAGVVGGAYTFDGGTNYISVDDNPSLGGTGTWSQISIGFWIQLSGQQSGTTVVAKKVASTKYANKASYMIGFEPSGSSPSDTLFWGINNDSTLNVTQSVWDNSSTVLSVGQWYYVVCTYKSGQGLTIYINGIQNASMPLTGNIMPGAGTSIYNQPLFIGWDGGSASRWFKGSLDEIMISPRAFTPAEIMQQYLQSKNGFSNVSTIVSQEINSGENWNCTITPNDSFRDGITKMAGSSPTLGLVISAPSPADGATAVPTTLSTLSFTLTDNQGKPMNYTVTTTPNIGVGNGTNVNDGTYDVTISGLTSSTTYTWVVSAMDGSASNTTAYMFTTQQPPNTTVPWWNLDWNYRKSVIIDHTKVSAALTNFPMLVDITDSGLAAHAQTNGNDIVFVDSNGNKLNHEIESYISSNGHLTAWVMIPNLSSTSDTILYMYCGNPSALNQQNPNGVWDSSFLMVQHLKETLGTQYDSTSKHNNGTPAGAVTQGTAGKIGNCDQFTGGYVSLPQVCTSQMQFTFSAWIYAQSGARYFISEWANNQGAFLQVFGNSQVQLYVNGVSGISQPLSLNQWHYVVGTYDGTTARLWVDGGAAVTVSVGAPTWPTSQSMYIGNNNGNTRQFLGLIDEVRVSSIARSNSWINTEYANQNNPSTFYIIGTQEIGPTTLAPIVSNPSPADGASGVAVNPTLSVSVNDLNPMNITFLSNSTGSWQTLGNYTNVTSGEYYQNTNMNGNGTTYWWSVQVTDGTYWTNKTFSFTTKTLSSNWWNSSWQYRVNVTIDHTKVSSNQSNFPLLVDLTNHALVTEAQGMGQDFVFVDINNHQLDDQIESYNNSTGHLVAWVRIPLLSSTLDTTITMYYGNPTIGDQQNPTSVWDSNYLMVLHLSENQTQYYDSTMSGNNGTLSGKVSQAPGKIGGSLNFAGGYVTLPQVCTSQMQFTFSAWIYAQSGARYFISEWANYQGAFLQVSGDSQVQFYVNSIMVSQSLSLNQWHYVVGTYNGTTATLSVDGGSPATVPAGTLTWPTSQGMYIGDRYDHIRQFYGLIDEVRVSSIARSNGWINTEYANQNNPSTFYTIGPEEVFSG
jgi:hypothetical protein